MAITVINMIPNSMSNEKARDSEPNVAVDLSNTQRIAASAFTPDPMNSGNGPIFVSTDGGNTWLLNVCLPGGSTSPDAGGSGGFSRTVDVTLRFPNATGVLYSGILRYDTSNLEILRKADFTVAGLMTTLLNRANEDQPWVTVATVLGGAGLGNDRVYVGHNDFNAPSGETATSETSLNAATAPAPAGLTARRLDPRTTCGQDGPSIRPAIHPDGTIYAVYFRWTACGSPPYTGDIVVARDDNWATGPTPFTALIDPDTFAGRRVATGVSFPWGSMLGTQRIGSQLAIAVDPRDSDTVYIAWCDGTSASNYTVRVRRSTNGGANWTGDLRAIAKATNPGLAINSRGRVGLLYQQLGNPGTGNRWRTHFETTTDGFATPPTDLILADVPDQNGPYTGANPIGDYACLIAAGKDFYGVFSANNTPDNANFPHGVTYLRKANFATNTLLDASNNPVQVSIDPFFFRFVEVAPENDFYVRDWTDSPTSGDNGVEPSTHPVFYLTSDVWNRRKNNPGAFNANDQPQNEYPKMGPANAGRNFGFVRIRRNAGGTAATVTAHFLVSPFGTGSPYQNADANPDLSVPFAAGDLVKTPSSGYEWHIGPTMTDHLCFAVELTGPADPVASPSLLGHTPGWPSTDLMVLNDNNKAQRNMYPPATSGAGDASYFALVRNGATFRRDLVLGYRVAPRVLKQLGRLSIGIVGERGAKRSGEGQLVLAGMEPGERRWVSITVEARQGNGRTPLPILFEEIVGKAVVNGFAIAPVPSRLGAAIRSNLELHQFRFGRLAAAFGISAGTRQSADARKLLGAKQLTGAVYLRFLREHLEGAGACIGGLVSKAGSDPFGLKAALRRVEKAVDARSADEATPAHATLLGALDAFQTMLELEEGDPACVLHNVEWQRDLYTNVRALAQLEGSTMIVNASNDFARGFEARKHGAEQFPRHMKRVLPVLRDTAKALPKLRLGPAVDALEKSIGSAAHAQRAHRELLLRLSTLRTSENGGAR